MYSTLGRGNLAQPSIRRDASNVENTSDDDDITYVNEPSPEDVQNLAQLYSTLSRAGDEQLPGVHEEFSDFLEKERRGKHDGGFPLKHLAVSFKDVTTWGIGGEAVTTKTFVDAVWRTLIMRDIYEWTIKPWLHKPSRDECRPLIRNISGAVRDGEMMLYV